MLDATNAFELIVTDEARLAGLPESAREAARESAAARNVEGWRFTLYQPSYVAVLTYAEDRALREQLYRAYNTRASAAPFDNRPLIAKILELRKEKARLLGFQNFADLTLADRMARDGERAKAFINQLREATKPFYNQESLGVALRSRRLRRSPFVRRGERAPRRDRTRARPPRRERGRRLEADAAIGARDEHAPSAWIERIGR